MAHTHCTEPGQGQEPGNDGILYYTMYCTLHRDNYKEPLFSIVPIPFPITVPVPHSGHYV